MVPPIFEGFVYIKNCNICIFRKWEGRGGSKAVWNFSENSSVLVPCSIPNHHINFPCHLLSTTLTQFYLPEHKAMGSNAWKKLGELSAQVQNIVSKDKESGSPCKKLTCPPGTRRLIGWSLPPGEENGRNPRRTAGLKTFGRPAPSSACSLRPRSARSRSKSLGEPGPKFCGLGLTQEKKVGWPAMAQIVDSLAWDGEEHFRYGNQLSLQNDKNRGLKGLFAIFANSSTKMYLIFKFVWSKKEAKQNFAYSL